MVRKARPCIRPEPTCRLQTEIKTPAPPTWAPELRVPRLQGNRGYPAETAPTTTTATATATATAATATATTTAATAAATAATAAGTPASTKSISDINDVADDISIAAPAESSADKDTTASEESREISRCSQA